MHIWTGGRGGSGGVEDRTSLEEAAQHEPLHKTLKSSLLKELDVTIYK